MNKTAYLIQSLHIDLFVVGIQVITSPLDKRQIALHTHYDDNVKLKG